jgi:predicted transposase/invertase (TIGR01784 family)
MAQQYDEIFKEHFGKGFAKIAQELIGESVSDIKYLYTELRKQLRRRIDFVFQAKQNQQDCILHIEVQSKDEPDMLKRMYLYSAILFDKHTLPVRQFVISLLENSKMPSSINMGHFTYMYKLIRISEINYETFLKSRDTLIFTILGSFDEKDLPDVLRKIFQQATKFKMTAEEKFELRLDLEILAKKRKFVSKVVTLMDKLMPFDVKITDSPTALKLIEQGRKEGKIEGRKEGKKEGKIEGKIEGKKEAQLEIAEVMLKAGVNVKDVAKYTKLPLNQVETLAKKLKQGNKK